MKALDLINISKKELQFVSSNPYQESVWILNQILKNTPTDLYLEQNQKIKLKDQNCFLDKINKRKQGWPLSYILEEQWFMGKKFFIQEGVFTPRKDSEVLIEYILNTMTHPLRALDFGAGAGTFCLSLLSQNLKNYFVAVEIHLKSVACLLENASSFGVKGRLKVLKKDVSHLDQKDFVGFLGGLPNLIIANPPYVGPLDLALSQEVSRFEPPLALFSDEEGMGHIYSWFEKAINFLEPKGCFIFEFGYDQFEKVQKFLKSKSRLKSFNFFKDQNDIYRFAVCIKK
ncbi:MAG: HemK/PrmC family methyltransferase [Bdellovibrionales bacterium]